MKLMLTEESPGDIRNGQTILEIIVTIAIVVLLLTGLFVVALSSLKVNQNNRVQSIALRYAQEGLELARKLRDSDWNNFLTYGTTTGTLWCLDKAGSWTLAVGQCPVNIDNIYTRSAGFIWTDPTMQVDLMVSWLSPQGVKNTVLSTYFTHWK